MKMPGQAAPVGRVWSEQQEAIFKAFREPMKGNHPTISIPRLQVHDPSMRTVL